MIAHRPNKAWQGKVMLAKLTRTINDMQRFFLTISLVFLLILSGCSYSRFPWVYRIDVEQGNVIDSDKFAELKVGMTQKQVRYLLGSPVVRDTFNQNRWDYIYSFRTGKGNLERQRVTLVFEGDILSSIDKKDYEPRQINY